jgi:hypothetical protein
MSHGKRRVERFPKNGSTTCSPNRILAGWLLLPMALVIERLYRIRYLHRGTYRAMSAGQLCRTLWLSLSHPGLNTG